MKVLNSINRCYLQQLDINEELKKKVDEILKTNKKEVWHYFSRIKSEESYALKIETGRVGDPNNLEDFFACTIVVENSIEIKNAVEMIKRFFIIDERRPRTDEYTSKYPESFQYDDLRLYVRLKPKEDLPPENLFNHLSNLKFEIQVKTFLQHAWGIATHDIIYKSGDIDWATQRVAYQIKAMLEHAEISIHEIDKIKESDMLAKMNKKIKQLNQIKKFITNNWQTDSLPQDLVRLSESVYSLLNLLKLNTDELQILLNSETSLGKGTQTSNLSPYFIIIQTIINQKPAKITEFFTNDQSDSKIVIPTEVTTTGLTLNVNKIIRI